MWRWDLSVIIQYTRSVILIRYKGIVLIPLSSNNEIFMWGMREGILIFKRKKQAGPSQSQKYRSDWWYVFAVFHQLKGQRKHQYRYLSTAKSSLCVLLMSSYYSGSRKVYGTNARIKRNQVSCPGTVLSQDLSWLMDQLPLSAQTSGSCRLWLLPHCAQWGTLGLAAMEREQKCPNQPRAVTHIGRGTPPRDSCPTYLWGFVFEAANPCHIT